MTSDKKTTEEVLEQLTGLYQTSPVQFEELRKKLIDQTIESFPVEHRKRAQGLQFVIESRLRKYKDPVVRMNKMVEIFWEQFGLFQDILEDPCRVAAEKEKNKVKAKIIPFKERQGRLAQNV